MSKRYVGKIEIALFEQDGSDDIEYKLQLDFENPAEADIDVVRMVLHSAFEMCGDMKTEAMANGTASEEASTLH